MPCEVEVVWTEGAGNRRSARRPWPNGRPISRELVSEASDVWLDTTGWNKRPKPRKGKKKKEEQSFLFEEDAAVGKEVIGYEELCDHYGLDPLDPAVSRPSMDTGPIPENSNPTASPPMSLSPFDERHLRNATIVDQDAINRVPVAIVGVGAIGSHLAEMLAKLGVTRLTLIDFDEVDTINLGVQGFHEEEVGLPKVSAVKRRIQSINSLVETDAWNEGYDPKMVSSRSVVFSLPETPSKLGERSSATTGKRIGARCWMVEWLPSPCKCIASLGNRESMALYQASLFPRTKAYRESCTARATIYAASMAAAILCAQFKRWAMNQDPEPQLQFDLLAMDCFR